MWRPIGIIAGRLRQLTSILAERLSFGTPTTVTIGSGAITVTRSYHLVDSLGAAGSTTDLLTVNGGMVGQLLVLMRTNAKKIKLKDGSGNLRIAGDFTIDSDFDTITLLYTGTVWVEQCRSNN